MDPIFVITHGTPHHRAHLAMLVMPVAAIAGSIMLATPPPPPPIDVKKLVACLPSPPLTSFTKEFEPTRRRRNRTHPNEPFYASVRRRGRRRW